MALERIPPPAAPSLFPVFLVGAGPGDPDLLTLKALRCIEQAEVLVYDRLISKQILNLAPRGTARIYVGKASGHHSMAQEEITALLVALAKSGKRVVRLKGGDPFVFGRGSEEAMGLVEAGISFEVVPGITAASGCLAAAHVPLTHRGLAEGVHFITGHCQANRPLDLDWKRLADPKTTLVIYMGLAKLEEFRDKLIAAGLAPTSPALAISKGTTPEERRCFATLGTLPEKVAQAGLESPVLVTLGRVVGLAEQLATQSGLKETHESEDRNETGEQDELEACRA